jgi:hypothetical protein
MSLNPEAQPRHSEEPDEAGSRETPDGGPLTPTEESAASPAARLIHEAVRLDVVLVVLVLILAAFLAAFPVRNSDFWLHLASGRRIASGHFTPGVDPFSFTTSGVYWANTAWLYDLFFYGITNLAGGPDAPQAGYVVVGLKAALVVLIGLVMMLTRRRGASLWAPATGTLIALLAMSPRLLMQPALLSMLFLAVTIYLLERPTQELGAKTPYRSARQYWLLPLLFILWVNVDEWFILGPITVALFLVGQLLQQVFAPIRTGEDAPEPGLSGKLVVLFLVSLGACLINPYHIHAFALPGQLSPNIPRELLGSDPYLRGFLTSIFDTRTFGASTGDAAMVATYLLIAMGIGSFVLTFGQGWRWWRLMVWGAFFFLAAYQARLIPFFAVVAAPIMALNMQDFASSRARNAARAGAAAILWSIGGRLVCCLTCLVLILLSWPGWLHGSLPDGRRQHQVALRLEPDASLASAARQVAQWQSAGKIAPDAHMFNWIPDLPNYFAWYQPNTEALKGFLDYRFNLFPKKTFTDYLETRRAFRESGDRGVASKELTELLNEYKIQYLALNWADNINLELQMAVQQWTDWKILHMEGNTVILQRVGPPANALITSVPRFDPNRLAFESETVKAPAAGPGKDPQPEDTLQVYVDGPPVRPQQTVSASEYLSYFDLIRKQWPAPYIASVEPLTWAGLAGNAAGGPIVSTGGAPLTLLFSSLRTMAVITGNMPFEVLVPGTALGPPGALLLGIRYARQAIALDPNHPQAYTQLAAAYNYLSKTQEDRWAQSASGQGATPRQDLRRIQLTTVLEQILKVRPDDKAAHQALSEIYSQLQYLDLAQEHRKVAAALFLGAGPEKNETLEAYRTRSENIAKQLQQVDDELNKRRNSFEVAAQNQPLLEKVRIAQNYGLGQRALQLMIEADISQFKEDEIQKILELMLSQGRAEEVLAQMREEFRRFMRMNYDWFKAQATAALGNYEEAYQALESAADSLESLCMQSALQLSSSQIMHGESKEVLIGQRALVELRRQQADFIALAGIMALEQGDIARARQQFIRAIGLGDGHAFIFESKPIATRYLELIDGAASTSPR